MRLLLAEDEKELSNALISKKSQNIYCDFLLNFLYFFPYLFYKL